MSVFGSGIDDQIVEVIRAFLGWPLILIEFLAGLGQRIGLDVFPTLLPAVQVTPLATGAAVAVHTALFLAATNRWLLDRVWPEAPAFLDADLSMPTVISPEVPK